MQLCLLGGVHTCLCPLLHRHIHQLHICVAHVAQETREIYAQGNVFLYFLPPNVTESLQAIDAGYGRSMRCAIGRLLDKWLMDEDNMALWEDEGCWTITLKIPSLNTSRDAE